MEQAKKHTAKEKKLKIAFSVTALVLIMAVTLLLVFRNSGAWLLDRGEWTNAVYKVGRIDYTYEINGGLIDLDEETTLTATVPVIGGVKLNDQSADPSAPHYEQYAEENFNEGVTLAHIQIVNKSDFAVEFSYSILFQGMFDDNTNPQDLFYLILPSEWSVDTAAKRLTHTDGRVQSYKSYIRSVLPTAVTYDQMVAQLKDYYETGAGNGSKETSQLLKKDGVLNLNIFIWSEYSQLPFVTTSDGEEKLNPADPVHQQLNGAFTMTISVSQTQDASKTA